MKKNTICAAVILAALSASPLTTNAAPITLSAGESVLFNFDLTAFAPVNQITFLANPTNFDATDAGLGTCYDGLDGTGVGLGCLLQGYAFIGFMGFADGLFSMRVTATAGTFDVDPTAYAFYQGPTGGVAITPTVAGTAVNVSVPEPGSLGLLGIAIACLGFTSRRRVSA